MTLGVLDWNDALHTNVDMRDRSIALCAYTVGLIIFIVCMYPEGQLIFDLLDVILEDGAIFLESNLEKHTREDQTCPRNGII